MLELCRLKGQQDWQKQQQQQQQARSRLAPGCTWRGHASIMEGECCSMMLVCAVAEGVAAVRGVLASRRTVAGCQQCGIPGLWFVLTAAALSLAAAMRPGRRLAGCMHRQAQRQGQRWRQQGWGQQQQRSEACSRLRNCVCLLLGPVRSSYKHVTCACLLLCLLLQCPTPPFDLYTAAIATDWGTAVQAKQLERQLPLFFVTPATAQGGQLASFQQWLTCSAARGCMLPYAFVLLC
jgi:hypothetical protein